MTEDQTFEAEILAFGNLEDGQKAIDLIIHPHAFPVGEDFFLVLSNDRRFEGKIVGEGEMIGSYLITFKETTPARGEDT